MLAAVEGALPADCAIFAAAVADWRVAETGSQKSRKTPGAAAPTLQMVEKSRSACDRVEADTNRPQLVVGFAAETENLIANAQSKLARKGATGSSPMTCLPKARVRRRPQHRPYRYRGDVESWPAMGKDEWRRRWSGGSRRPCKARSNE